jgi:phosphate-selective porin
LDVGGGNLENLIVQGGYGSIGYWIFGNKRNGLLTNLRYEHVRVDDNSGGFNKALGTVEQPMELRSGTVGLAWYINPSVRLRGNYIITDLAQKQNIVGMSNSAGGNAHQGIAELMVQF